VIKSFSAETPPALINKTKLPRKTKADVVIILFVGLDSEQIVPLSAFWGIIGLLGYFLLLCSWLAV
jgi:hypothetical protein